MNQQDHVVPHLQLIVRARNLDILFAFNRSDQTPGQRQLMQRSLKRRNPGDYEATLQALGLPTPKEGKKRRRARL